MEPFVMEIAGAAVGVEPRFESTRAYCAAYLTDREPEFTIRVEPADLQREQMLLNREADEEGLKRRKFSDMFLERSYIQRCAAEWLLEKDTLMVHGSTVAVDGQAYLFTADCGTGKSTHTRLWREVFGDRAVMVNDDKPFLKLTKEGVLAYGSPWTGKHGLGENVCVPLKGICVLERGAENVIWYVQPDEVMGMLQHQTCMPEDERGEERAMELVRLLAERVPLWRMRCNREPDAAVTAHEAMSAV